MKTLKTALLGIGLLVLGACTAANTLDGSYKLDDTQGQMEITIKDKDVSGKAFFTGTDVSLDVKGSVDPDKKEMTLSYLGVNFTGEYEQNGDELTVKIENETRKFIKQK